MYYEKFWKKTGLTSRYNRALVESLVFAVIAVILIKIIPYSEMPIHYAVANAYKHFNIILSIPLVKLHYWTLHWIITGLAVWYPIKVVMSNIILVIVPHLKNIFDDDSFYEEMDYDIDDEEDKRE